MESLNNMLDKIARPLLVKWLTRLVAWGCTAIAAKVAVEAPAEDTQGQVVQWTVTVLLGAVAAGIDWWHSRKDKAEASPEQAAEIAKLKAQLSDSLGRGEC
jgi:hypothetical protein